MKVRMEEGLQLIITPESYVEQIALSKWVETIKGECGLLIESYAQHKHALDAAGFCAHDYQPPVVHLCPECKLPADPRRK